MWVILFPKFDRGNTPAISLTLITLHDAEQRRAPQESMPPSRKAERAPEPASKTSFLVYNVEQRFKIECYNVKLFV